MQNLDLHSNLNIHIFTNYTARNPKITFKKSRPLFFLDGDMPISHIKTIDVSISLVKFNYSSAFSPNRYCLAKYLKNVDFINQKVVFKLISVPHTHLKKKCNQKHIVNKS